MNPRTRSFEPLLRPRIQRPFVHILFGARQTGKSTLIRRILPGGATILDLSDPRERARFAANPGLFLDLCRALPRSDGGSAVFVDEAQTVPAIFDAVQSLYDADKERYRFILCGSSARRLREAGANLLPGRSVRYLLHPLLTEEYEGADEGGLRFTGLLPPISIEPPAHPFPARSLESRLVFGDLPGIALCLDDRDKADLLVSYATSYLEEEVCRETLVRDWGAFVRFLRLSAGESGCVVNFAALSREAGLPARTIKSYYQLLEDMFVGFSVGPFSGSVRKSALASPRFFFFDLGVRNAAAELPLVEATVNAAPGGLFEQWVAAQLWRRLSYLGSGKLSYYRTSDGAEVDFIVEREGGILPIEVKWTENPCTKDCRHLRAFVAEHRDRVRGAYLVSRCPHVLALEEGVTGIPYWLL